MVLQLQGLLRSLTKVSYTAPTDMCLVLPYAPCRLQGHILYRVQRFKLKAELSDEISLQL